MPTIEQLNFDLIIDDKQFNAQVQRALRDAKDLNIQLSNLLNLRKQFAGSARGAAQDERDLSKAIDEQTRRIKDNTNAVRAGTAAAKAFNAERYKMKGFNLAGSLSGNASSLSELTSLATQYVSILGGAKLVKAITQVTAEFELQRITLRAILQDIEGADAIFRSIKQLAVVSPFSFKELVTYAKQLSAYSIPMNELYETTKMLADVSAGIGVGMDRLALVYGQIRSASFLRGQEVRQLTESFIPILEELRKQFVELGEEGITVGDVFDKISNRMVPFEMVSKVFQNMTSEGGKFYKMQEVQAETLRGKISNLKDAYDIMFDKMGNKNMESLKGAVDWVRSLAENYQKTTRILAELVAAFGTYKAVILLVTAVEKGYMVINTVVYLTKLIGKMNALRGSVAALTAAYKYLGAAKSLSIGAGILGTLSLITTAIVKAVQNAKELDKTLNKTLNEKYGGASKLASDFDLLVKRLEGAKRGSQEYRDAIAELNRKYGEYMPKLATEIDSLEVLRGKIANVTDAIYNRAKAYAYEAGIQAIEEKNQQDLDKPMTRVMDILGKMDISDVAIQNFLQKFREAVIADAGKTSGTELMKETAKSFFGEASAAYRHFVTVQYTAVNDLAESYLKAEDRIKKLNIALDARFDKSEYNSVQEMNKLQAVNAYYDGLIEKEKAVVQSQEEYNAALNRIEISRLKSLADVYDQFNRPDKAKEIREKIAGLEKVVTGWRALVNNIVGSKGNRDLIAKEDQSINEYIDDLQKEYKNLAEQYKQAQNAAGAVKDNLGISSSVTDKDVKNAQDYADSLKRRKDIIEQIAKVLRFSLDSSTTAGTTGRKSSEQNELETRINTVKELYGWFNKLKDAEMNGDEIKRVLASFFPEQSDIINAESYKEILLQLADALEKYGDSAAKAAQGLREDVLGAGLYNLLNNFKERKKFLEDVNEYLSQPFGKSGSGALFDINSIVLKYRRAMEKISEERKKMLADADKYSSKDSESTFLAGSITMKSIEEEKDALAQANEEIRKEAEKWVKSWDKIASFDIERFGDLTTRELRKLRDTLKGFSFDEIPENLKSALQNVDGGLKAFISGVEEYLDKLQRKTDEKLLDKLFNDLRSMVGDIQNVLSSVQDLAATSGSGGLASAISRISSGISGVFDVLEKIKNQDYLGAAVSSISQLASAILDAQTRALEASNAFAQLKRDVASYLAELKLNEGVDTMFGQNTIQSLKNAYSNLKEYTDKMEEKFSGMTVWRYDGLTVLKRNLYDVREIVQSFGYDWEDLDQRLQGLQALLKLADAGSGDFSALSGADRQNLEEYISYLETIDKANQAITDIIKEAWSSLADSMADSMISAYVQMGDAAYGLADEMDSIFSQLGQNIAKSLISSFVIDNILSKYNAQLVAIYDEMGTKNDPNKIAQLFGSIATSVSKDAEIAAEFTNGLMSALEKFGVSFSSSSEKLSSGITSITEDTANLLASYINAMRSDLAGHRMEVQGIGADIKVLLGLLPSSPTLAEYLAQIQANTYNTSVSAAEILNRLDSVVGDGASSYIRIQ